MCLRGQCLHPDFVLVDNAALRHEKEEVSMILHNVNYNMSKVAS